MGGSEKRSNVNPTWGWGPKSEREAGLSRESEANAGEARMGVSFAQQSEGGAQPPLGTLERWAFDYITSTTLEAKLSPPPLPETAWEERPRSRRALRPGRPASLQPATKKSKTPKGEQLRDPKKRAQLLHGFLHHELQAAELFAWAMLTFVDAPRALRLGWLKIALDECRHMRMYEGELQRLGFTYGDFGVRDWF